MTEASPLHGGRLLAARRAFPGAPEPFLDLSTGINPHPYPLPDLPAAAFTRLPEPEEMAALEATAARVYGVVDPALAVAAPGTQALIQWLPRLFPAREVAVLGPTYAEHAHSWRAAGAWVREVATPEALAQAEVAVLCNPNNPDGRRWPSSDVLKMARGRLLIVDEAFADLEEEGLSIAPRLPHSGVVVLRSFGKTYGLAGLRLGFALAAPARAAAIRAALGPWAVSGVAIAIGCAALADAPWRAAMRERLLQAAATLDTLLRGAGLRVIGGTALFRLAEGDHAPALYELLGRAGILVRRFPDRPTWLRFGLPGAPEAWARLREALSAARAPI
jgi:cobalamin biosynthetic protein CobC